MSSNFFSIINLTLLSLCYLLSNCSTDSTTKHTSTKFKQYYIKGEQLYLQHCSNCHQKDGTGLGLLYPPLDKSDFLENNYNEVICLIKNGIEGELIVNNKSFNKKMTGISSLSDIEIAEIATYIYNTWENKKGLTEVKDVTAILTQCR